MSLVETLKWRYATKRMNGTKVSEDKIAKVLDAIQLTPTSYGLQPFKAIVIADQNLKEKIFNEACQQPQIKESSHLIVFAATIALGVAMVAAGEEKIDATPIEGFNPQALDAILGLSAKNLGSVTILALGYRDEANDPLAKAKKVRKSQEALFLIMD